MEPFDKVSARANAFGTLGLAQSASSDDIREAWRDIAFEAHPDKNGGDGAALANAKAAYDLLRSEGLAGKGLAGSAAGKPRRPRLRKRVIQLETQDIDACRAMLNTALPHLQDSPDTPADSQDADRLQDADHIPDAVGLHGRNLTYFISAPVCEGANRVALPTSVLAGSKRVKTEILSFQSKDAGTGEVVVPVALATKKFPGARSVRIRFNADQQTQDEYWLAG
ncbi:J domain-containing protein [Ruegeria faecimaris]|uniref:J domain-containing protein n=1 Tax=Ruegeria faecimaris TaxID=686389 RepID=UPI0024935290|nr:J domain-containing protein [Ruegeria faecimaris]